MSIAKYMLGLCLALSFAQPAAAKAASSIPSAPLDRNTGAAMECAALKHTDFSAIPGAATTISSASIVEATPGAKEYCKVEGVIVPQIGFEIRLPTQSWNGRYFQTGCGGMCGDVMTDRYCGDAQAKDFVVAAHDMGHKGGPWDGAPWGANPEQREDFAKRSTHVMSVVAKKVIAAYYGRTAAHSYFRGCSTGGREALGLAQFYPEDFDGIIGGDFAMPIRQGAIANTWDAQHLLDEHNADIFSDEKIQLLHKAVMAACDKLDGVEDGLMADPRKCRFDPKTLQCPPGKDGSACLTARQVEAAIALYDGPRNSKGERLTPGGRALGSELAWLGGAYGGGASRTAISEGTLRNLAFAETRPDFGYRDFDWDRHVAEVETQVAEFDVMAPRTAPDLTAFQKAGRKLILYHGWWDPGVPAVGTLDYYAQVYTRQGGLEATQDWFRVFMVPGMFHCRGGDAPNQFDMLGAMVAWVEQGRKPDGIVATQMNEDGSVNRTRPLYAYPGFAEYAGTGDVNDAANWRRGEPEAQPEDLIDWIWAPAR